MAKLKLKLQPDSAIFMRDARRQGSRRHGNDGIEAGLEDGKQDSMDWSLIPNDPFGPAEPVRVVLKDERTSGDWIELGLPEYREEERPKTRMSGWGRVVVPPGLSLER
jgi:hypothetical protein